MEAGKVFTGELDPEVFYNHAEICKVLANPKRLMILYFLSQGEKSVREIAEALGIPEANASQHLAKLRSKGLVSTEKRGAFVYYRLTDERITKACELIRAVLLDRIKSQARLAQKIEDMESPFWQASLL